jgi:hypothetical protein
MKAKAEQYDAATEVKALVALAFRNGPIESLHSGKRCPTCEAQPGYGRIADPEMKEIMKYAVNQLYRLLRLKAEDALMYHSEVMRGAAYTAKWDEPESSPAAPAALSPSQLAPKVADGGVLVAIPLAPLQAAIKREKPPLSFAKLRNRLEQMISVIGIHIQSSGLASAYECKVGRNRLNLLLAGHDTEAIATELKSYLSLFQLPEHSKMIVFAPGSTEPAEIDLNKNTIP